jgi:hypothetical protein
MVDTPYKPFRGRTIRVTQLDDCCTPPASGTECALYVSDGFVTVTLEPNVEEGETALERKANGDVCLNEKDPDLLQNLTVSLVLCQVRSELVSMLTGWPVVRDSDGNGVGFDIMEGATEAQTAFELWSGVSGIDCGEGARYGYNALPCVSGWQLGENLEWGGIDVISSITLNGTTSGSHTWGTGPYAVQGDETGTPGPLLDPIQTGAHARIMSTDVPPPDVTVGCVPATAENGYILT